MKIKKFIPQNIIIVLILAVCLNIIRIVISKSYSSDWLLWNMLLAMIPFAISSFLLSLAEQKKLNKFVFIIGGIFWLLFIPNAPYIITDLIHLGVSHSMPVLYDVFLFFSSAWVGLYLGMNSILQIEQVLKMKYSKITVEITIFITMIFISFGIYLGRFLRFNSWDVFNYPVFLLKTIHQKTFLVPSNHIEMYLYISLFTFFLFMFYKAFKSRKES